VTGHSAEVAALEVLTLRLRLRYGFAHARAERRASSPLLVRLTLADGTVGYGEALPRTYVTGEDEGSVRAGLLGALAALVLGRPFPDLDAVSRWLADPEVAAARERAPAALGALELALLDAAGRSSGRPVFDLLGPPRCEPAGDGVVVGFMPERLLDLFLERVRASRPRVVKVKVGREDDLPRLERVRRALGEEIDLRVDANGAWSPEEAVRRVESFAPYRVSVVEQPVAGRDLEGLAQVAAEVEVPVMADESLTGLRDALRLLELAPRVRWNLRVGKCGGLVSTLGLARLARGRGVPAQLGVMVGESGLLAAAGRIAAAVHGEFEHVETAPGMLADDVVAQADSLRPAAAPGLGVDVCPHRVAALTVAAGEVRRTRVGAAPRLPPSHDRHVA